MSLKFRIVILLMLCGSLLLAQTVGAASPQGAKASSGSPTLLVLGDSLSAGYGIRTSAAWPTLLNQRIAEKGLNYNVVNASISGETTSGGRSRLPELLSRHRPEIVVIALGSNDGLRGLAIKTVRENLESMIQTAKKAKTRVVLVGMRLPPNYGDYAAQFQQVYPDIAQRTQLPFVEFLLAGIADQPQLFQSDALHPTAEAQSRILDNVWVVLAPLIK